VTIAKVLIPIFVVLALTATAGCKRSMGRLTEVRLQRVAWAEVNKQGLSAGCCGTMEWIRVDFLSDVDYARLANHGIQPSVRYGWCPVDRDHDLGATRLLSDIGEVNGATILIRAAGDAKHPLYAYHAFFPSSHPARRYGRPGGGDGAYDLRDAKGDFCIAVGGGVMWLGRYRQSNGGVVPKAELSKVLGP
jgi:hypothetical protein